MHCSYLTVNGIHAMVCRPRPSPKRCVACRARITVVWLCDGPGKTADTTCDAALCERCRVHQAPNQDFCPQHAHTGQGAKL